MECEEEGIPRGLGFAQASGDTLLLAWVPIQAIIPR